MPDQPSQRSAGPIPDLFSPLASPFRLDGDPDGDAVVLVHGFTGIPGHFRPLAEHLHAHGLTVNVPLLPGHGTGPEHMDAVSIDDWHAAVIQAADAVSHHRNIHLVGLSLGGLLSIIAAPDVAATSITTIDSPVIVRDTRLYVSAIGRFFVPFVGWTGEPAPHLDPEVADLWLTYDGFPTAAGAQLVRAIVRGYRTARRMRRPALVIQSRADETVRPVSATLLAHAMGSRSRILWLDRSMHNALIDSEREIIHTAVLEQVTA